MLNYYDEIKNKLLNNEITKRVKDYSKNKSDLDTYYNVGMLLSEAGKHYGEGIIKEYSRRLTNELGKGYSRRNLYNMKLFFEKVQTVSANLTWSHYSLIVSFDKQKMNYYIKITECYNLSFRNLRERIKNKEYERLPEETRVKLITREVSKTDCLVNIPCIILLRLISFGSGSLSYDLA